MKLRSRSNIEYSAFDLEICGKDATVLKMGIIKPPHSESLFDAIFFLFNFATLDLGKSFSNTRLLPA